MGYMRFFDTSDVPLDLNLVESALKRSDPSYRIEQSSDLEALSGGLYFGDGLYGEIEINLPCDGLFDAELEEHLEAVNVADVDDDSGVAETLRTVRRTIAVRVLWQDRETEETLVRIDPLWGWLFESRSGLLHADGEGFYNSRGLVLAIA